MQIRRRYLSPYTPTAGLGPIPKRNVAEEEQIQIEVGSRCDSEVLASQAQRFAPFGIVIDDERHHLNNVGITFQHSLQHVGLYSLYIIKGLHTALWPSFEGRLGASNSFIEFGIKVMNTIHANHSDTEHDWAAFLLEMAIHTHTVRIIDSMINYEKICPSANMFQFEASKIPNPVS